MLREGMNKGKFPIGKEKAVSARITLRGPEACEVDMCRGSYAESYKHFQVYGDLASTRVNLADSVYCPSDDGPLERFREFVVDKVKEVKESVLEKIFHRNKKLEENKWEEYSVIPGHSIERVLERFFNECNGQTDVLNMDATFMLSRNSWREEPSRLPRLKEALAGRPISTILYIQHYMTPVPNNPTPTFLREYIDFKMFAISNRGSEQKPLEISDKLLKCEFLYLNCDVTNPERLKEFEGWGLVLDSAEEKGFDFQFFVDVVKTWYSGNPVQWTFLGLICAEIDEEKWESQFSLGKQVIYDRGDKDTQITREDGTTCHIGKSKTYYGSVERHCIFFHLGESTPSLRHFTSFQFNLDLRDFIDA